MKTKFLQYTGLFMRTVLVIPVTSCAFFVFSNLSSENYSSSLKILAPLFASLALIVFFFCLTVFLFLFIDNSPFSLLPFANLINFNEAKKVLFKTFLGLFGGIANNLKD